MPYNIHLPEDKEKLALLVRDIAQFFPYPQTINSPIYTALYRLHMKIFPQGQTIQDHLLTQDLIIVMRNNCTEGLEVIFANLNSVIPRIFADKGFIELKKILLDNPDYIDKNATYAEGKTALMLATAANDPATVELLISKGARIDTVDQSGRKAVDYADLNHTDGDECARLLKNARPSEGPDQRS